MVVDEDFKRRLLVARIIASGIAFGLAVVVSLVLGLLFYIHARESQRYEFRLYTCQQIEKIKSQVVKSVSQNDATVDSLVGRIPGYTRADAERAHKLNAETRARFAPVDIPCEEFAKLRSLP